LLDNSLGAAALGTEERMEILRAFLGVERKGGNGKGEVDETYPSGL
jgi:hypothetical protein